MIIGILLALLIGGGVSAVGNFLVGFVIFGACTLVILTIALFSMFFYQNHSTKNRKSHNYRK